MSVYVYYHAVAESKNISMVDCPEISKVLMHLVFFADWISTTNFKTSATSWELGIFSWIYLSCQCVTEERRPPRWASEIPDRDRGCTFGHLQSNQQSQALEVPTLPVPAIEQLGRQQADKVSSQHLALLPHQSEKFLQNTTTSSQDCACDHSQCMCVISTSICIWTWLWIYTYPCTCMYIYVCVSILKWNTCVYIYIWYVWILNGTAWHANESQNFLLFTDTQFQVMGIFLDRVRCSQHHGLREPMAFFPPNICYAVYICIYVCVQRIAGGSLGSCHSRISAYHIQQISDTNHRFDHWLWVPHR